MQQSLIQCWTISHDGNVILLIDRIMASSIVPIMSTKLAIPYRVIYMIFLYILIYDLLSIILFVSWMKVSLVLISAQQTCLSLEWGSNHICCSLICCCFVLLAWGNCMGSCSWPIIVSSNFVTPQPTFSRPHYV